MYSLIIFIVAFISSLIGATIATLRYEKRIRYECKGKIVLSNEELYLTLTEEDMEAFKYAKYAVLELQRENFKGFNET